MIATLGLGEEPGRPATAPVERLVEFARDKSLLLVLDGCEHLTAACAAFAERLLRAAPGVKVLAVSREALEVVGEARWPVPPLAVPRAGETAGTLSHWDAVRLFCERAELADSGFRLDAENGPAVAELCRRLDGLPLAIELAAAWIRPSASCSIGSAIDSSCCTAAAVPPIHASGPCGRRSSGVPSY